MEETNKKSKKIFKIVTAIAAIYGAAIAFANAIHRLADKVESHNSEQKKKTYINFMNGRSLSLENEEVEEISIDACMGGMDLDLRKADLADVTFINIRSIMSGVVVKVPPMVNVRLENSITIMGGFANMVPKYEEEDLKTIVVRSSALMCGVCIKMVPDINE